MKIAARSASVALSALMLCTALPFATSAHAAREVSRPVEEAIQRCLAKSSYVDRRGCLEQLEDAAMDNLKNARGEIRDLSKRTDRYGYWLPLVQAVEASSTGRTQVRTAVCDVFAAKNPIGSQSYGEALLACSIRQAHLEAESLRQIIKDAE